MNAVGLPTVNGKDAKRSFNSFGSGRKSGTLAGRIANELAGVLQRWVHAACTRKEVDSRETSVEQPFLSTSKAHFTCQAQVTQVTNPACDIMRFVDSETHPRVSTPLCLGEPVIMTRILPIIAVTLHVRCMSLSRERPVRAWKASLVSGTTRTPIRETGFSQASVSYRSHAEMYTIHIADGSKRFFIHVPSNGRSIATSTRL